MLLNSKLVIVNVMQRKQNCFPDLEFLSKVSVFLSCLCGLNQFLWLLFESNCVLGPKLLGRRLDWEARRFQLISNRERKFKVVWHHVGLSQTFSVIIVIKHQTGFEHSRECPTVPDLTRGERSSCLTSCETFTKFHPISLHLIVIAVMLLEISLAKCEIIQISFTDEPYGFDPLWSSKMKSWLRLSLQVVFWYWLV